MRNSDTSITMSGRTLLSETVHQLQSEVNGAKNRLPEVED